MYRDVCRDVCRDGTSLTRSFSIRERPISFVFFNRSKPFKTMNLVRSQIIVHFPSVSFVFSLNNHSVQSFIQLNRPPSKIVCIIKSFLQYRNRSFFQILLEKIVHSVKTIGFVIFF